MAQLYRQQSGIDSILAIMSNIGLEANLTENAAGDLSVGVVVFG